MKKFSLKFSFVFSLAVFTALFLSGFFTSCAADAESTKLVVNLGSSSRAALNASESNTSYYIVLVENDVSSVEKRGEKGSVVVFDEIPVGTYNVKISAYDAADNLLASSTQEANVILNKVCEVALALKSGFKTNNDIWLWNINSDYSNAQCFLKKFPVLNKNTELSFWGEDGTGYSGYDIINDVSFIHPYYYSFAENKNGWTAYICNDDASNLDIGLRFKKRDGRYYNSIENFGENFSDSLNWNSFMDPLYYDISDDTFVAASMEDNDSGIQINFSKYNTIESSDYVYLSPAGCIKFSGITDFTSPLGLACAKKGDSYYFSVYDDDERNLKCVLYRCHVTDVDENGDGVGEIDAQISMEDIGLAGAFMDIAVLDDGSLYALAFQKACSYDETEEYKGIDLNLVNTISIPSFSNSNNIYYYSRGALVKFNESEAGLSLDFAKGWTNLREMRASGDKEATINWVKEQSENISPEESEVLCITYEPDRLNGAFPTADEKEGAFFGPMKIVAIKPKELYIVDCGVSIKLADWDAKKSGGYFGHDRVMKFDLESFGLSCVKDETIPLYINEFNGSNAFEQNNKLSNFLAHGEISMSMGSGGIGKIAYDSKTLDTFITPAFEE